MLTGRHFVVLLCCLAAAPASAQTLSHPQRAFVEVTAAPDWDDLYSGSNRAPGATVRSGVALGIDWGRAGLEVDVSVPQWHVRDYEVHSYQYVGPSSGWQQHNHFYENASTVRRRSIDVSALYRANVPLTRRMTFSWLVGGGYLYRPQEFTSVTTDLLPGGQRTEVDVHRSTSSRNYLTATARADIEFRVVPNVSVVPPWRVTGIPAFLDDSGSAPRLLIVRPEVGIRWQF
jgi:hypothetical protein